MRDPIYSPMVVRNPRKTMVVCIFFFFLLERDPIAVEEPLPIKGYKKRVREWIQDSMEKKSRKRQKKTLGLGDCKSPQGSVLWESIYKGS